MLIELAAALCFGAASRDPEVPCVNPALERTVSPTPARARTLPNSPCRTIVPGSPSVCRFGAADGAETFALVGDSHAGHWRAAFLEPPVYAGHHEHGLGTLYTAVYRPADLTLEYRWPGSSWRHSIGSFSSGQHQVVLGGRPCPQP